MNKLFTFFLALVANVVTMFANFDYSTKEQINDLYYIFDLENKKACVVASAYWDGNYSGLTSANIPEFVSYNNEEFNVTNIELGAFYKCADLISIKIPNSITTIEVATFQECTSLTSIEIPNSVISIGTGAFMDCTSLTSVNISNNVNSIGGSAFRGCTSLTSLVIPNSVLTVGVFAFEACSSLTSVTIGNSVTTIGSEAFYKCNSLEVVICLAQMPPTMEQNVFRSVDCSKIPLYVPEESINAYKAAEQWKDFTNIFAINTEDIKQICSVPKEASRKFLHNGQVLILRDDRTYNMQGQQVK